MAKQERRSRAAWLPLWIVMTELVVIMLVVPPSWMRQVEADERRLVLEQMGPDSASWIEGAGSGLNRLLFVDSGVRNAVELFLIPTEAERAASRGLETFGTKGYYPFVAARIEVTFKALERLCHRIAMISAWLPFLGLAVALVFWRAAMDWRRRRWTYDYASPLMRSFGAYLAGGAVALSAALVFVPWPLQPVIGPIVAGMVAIGIGWFTANTQKVV